MGGEMFACPRAKGAWFAWRTLVHDLLATVLLLQAACFQRVNSSQQAKGQFEAQVSGLSTRDTATPMTSKLAHQARAVSYQLEPHLVGRYQSHQNQPEPDYYYPDSQSQQQPPGEIPLSNFNNLNPGNRQLDKEYLSHDIAERACRLDRGCQRKDRLNRTYLSYCARYKLESLFSNEVLMSIMHDSVEECDKILDEFIQLDELINQFDYLFKNLLTRYNCHNGYSVKWSCEDCKKAYKDWLCATNLPHYMNGERIKPCISFCERVEQRCPYLHPITKEQYGGQPVFICRDPNIPFVPEITPDIPYSEPAKCYDLCHLSDNLTELITDSLSKYDYDKCPDKGSIAEEVRSDRFYCESDHQEASPNLTAQYNPIEEHDDESTRGPRQNITIDQNQRTNLGSPVKPVGLHVHAKKLIELREVLAVYKSQPKTHKFGHYSEHNSLESNHMRAQDLHQTWLTEPAEI